MADIRVASVHCIVRKQPAPNKWNHLRVKQSSSTHHGRFWTSSNKGKRRSTLFGNGGHGKGRKDFLGGGKMSKGQEWTEVGCGVIGVFMGKGKRRSRRPTGGKGSHYKENNISHKKRKRDIARGRGRVCS